MKHLKCHTFALLLTACGPADGVGPTIPLPAVSEDASSSAVPSPAGPPPANTQPVRLPFDLFPDPSPNDYIVELGIAYEDDSGWLRVIKPSSNEFDEIRLGSLQQLLEDRQVDGNPHYGRLVDDIQRAILKAADSEERVRNLRVLIEMNPDSNESSVLKLKSTVPWGFVTMVIDAVMELSKVLYHSERRHASIPITFSNPPSAPGAD